RARLPSRSKSRVGRWEFGIGVHSLVADQPSISRLADSKPVIATKRQPENGARGRGMAACRANAEP
ncbi:MAG: hypothetical protein WAV47_13410, partial [Blastocatellia bacterium]